MDKIRRFDRMAVMTRILTENPNKIFTLSQFCAMFGAAKSTLSEDIALLQDDLEHFGLGTIETVTGAAGGVRYRPLVTQEKAQEDLQALCDKLSGTERVLPGGFLYFSDVLSDPQLVRMMGGIIATEYYEAKPDFVLTMETKGIPVALETAQALAVPLVIARHASRVYEGSAVNINYVSGSSGSIQTMSLSRRAVKPGSSCLIVDDFLKGGGTAKGMCDLMREFDVTVLGKAFVMATAEPQRKRVSDYKALMQLTVLQLDETEIARVTPWTWTCGRQTCGQQ